MLHCGDEGALRVVSKDVFAISQQSAYLRILVRDPLDDHAAPKVRQIQRDVSERYVISNGKMMDKCKRKDYVGGTSFGERRPLGVGPALGWTWVRKIHP